MCLDHDPETAADYNTFFGAGLGMWQAGDVPHQYPLPDGRVLWLLNDSFVSPVDPAGPLTTDWGFVHNVAFVQSGPCVTALTTLDADHHPQPYFADPSPGRWYWPLGGVVHGDNLLVFLAEVSAPLPLSWALRLTPRRTMVATIDGATLAVTGIQPAPDPDVDPIFGFSVVDDGTSTYLFGNDLVYGGNTATWLARVPSGQLGAAPYEYWTGSGWSSSRQGAQPVYDPGGSSYAVEAALVAGRWYAVAKDDDFFGTNIDVLSAPGPTGPWKVGATFRVPAKARPGAEHLRRQPAGRAPHRRPHRRGMEQQQLRLRARRRRPVPVPADLRGHPTAPRVAETSDTRRALTRASGRGPVMVGEPAPAGLRNDRHEHEHPQPPPVDGHLLLPRPPRPGLAHRPRPPVGAVGPHPPRRLTEWRG